jgi:hypothetical protein
MSTRPFSGDRSDRCEHAARFDFHHGRADPGRREYHAELAALHETLAAGGVGSGRVARGSMATGVLHGARISRTSGRESASVPRIRLGRRVAWSSSSMPRAASCIPGAAIEPLVHREFLRRTAYPMTAGWRTKALDAAVDRALGPKALYLRTGATRRDFPNRRSSGRILT